MRGYVRKRARLKELKNLQRPLTKKEHEELKKLQEPKSPNERNFRAGIRKKVRQSMKDLALIFDTLSPPELRFYEKDYMDYGLPLVGALTRFYHHSWFFENLKNAYLVNALDLARKRYNYKRLITNEKYRQRMIDWLVKNRIELWNPPTIEEQKRRFERIKPT